MRSIHKIIKYLALLIAIIICINIGYAVLYGIKSIAYIMIDSKEKNKSLSNLKEIELDNNFTKLDIELTDTNLTITTGNKFSIKTSNSRIECLNKKGELTIKEKGNFFGFNLFKNNNDNIEIIIPSELIPIYEAKIDIKNGETLISDIKINKFEFEQGSGKIKLNNILVDSETEIQNGVGELIVENCEFNNSDINLGIGNTQINSILKGKNTIDVGIGNLDINLLPNVENYSLDIDKGVGNISIKGNKINHNYVVGNGANTIKINGGIGNIKIK